MNLDVNERDLFLSALEIEDTAARKSHLQAACGENVELLSRVEALLASHQGESQFLRTPVGEQLGPTGIDATLVMGLGSTHDETGRNGEAAASELEFKRNQERVEMSEEIPLGYLEPSKKPDSLGRLGHYEILEVIGRGAFGTVLRAFDEKLQRVVAIKVMAMELASTSPARKRFLREAQSSAQIRHEHVVSVYAVEEKPIPYLVMEYIPGQTLQQRLDEKGPLDLPNILRLGVQIAEGLAAAHAMDLIHRDIKPGNILLETGVRERVKITDFGLARAADDASMTQSGMIAGTPMYMAPEQALGHKLDQRADLFSLGSVLYQMVSGRPPFRASSTLAVLKRLTEETARPIQEIIPETPQWLCDIIAKLHAKNPDERYQSAREVADVLADCETQLKANSKLKDFSRIPRSEPSRVSGRVEQPRRRKWVAAAAVLLLPVLALAVTEFAGVTQLFRPQATPNPIKPGGDQTPVVIAKQEPLPPTFTDADVQRIAALPAEEQVKAVAARLKELNPGFDGKVEPTIDNGVVTGLKFNTNNVDNVAPVRALKGLVSLDCSATDRFKGKLRDLSPLKGIALTSLNIAYTKVTDLSPLKGMSLTGLDIGESQVHDLEPLKGMPLTTLWMSRSQVRDLAPLKGMKLETLEAQFIPASDLTPLQGMPLKSLDLYHSTSITNLQPIQDMPLSYLNVSGLEVSDFSVLKGLKSLEWLTLQGMKQLPDLKLLEGLRLTRLEMDASRLTDEEAEKLAAIKTLTYLRLGETQVTMAGVEKLAKALPKCKIEWDGGVIEPKPDAPAADTDRKAAEYVLSVGGTVRVNDEDRDINAAAELPKTPFQLTGIDLQLKPVTDTELAVFKDCKNLTRLWLPGTPVTDAGLGHFKGCTNLKDIYLSGWITDAGLAHLKDCKNLTHINLHDNERVTDAGLAHFKDCKNLMWIALSNGRNVGDAGWAHLKDCKNLVDLTVYGTKITDEGLLHFKAFKNLTRLQLNHTRVTDAGLAHLTGLDQLTDLQVIMTAVTAKGVEKLAKALPKCKITWDGGVIEPTVKAVAPFTDADVQRIAVLPAAGQVEEVRKELKKRNPGFDGKVEPNIENNVVVGLKFLTDKVDNIAPVRALKGLKSLEGCGIGFYQKGRLSDLSPLKGMPLTRCICSITRSTT